MVKAVALLCLETLESFVWPSVDEAGRSCGSQIPVAVILNLGNSVSAKADSFLEWMMPCALYES